MSQRIVRAAETQQGLQQLLGGLLEVKADAIEGRVVLEAQAREFEIIFGFFAPGAGRVQRCFS